MVFIKLTIKAQIKQIKILTLLFFKECFKNKTYLGFILVGFFSMSSHIQYAVLPVNNTQTLHLAIFFLTILIFNNALIEQWTNCITTKILNLQEM